MINSYEININTLAIIPINDKLSKIIEDDNIYTINQKTTDIIDHSCKYFGSSYSGRHEGTKTLIGVNYKTPVVIEESREIIFFPTSSPRFENCSWIALNKIKNYEKNLNNSKIIFQNDLELELNISYGSLENQILRATLLESTIRKRKNK